MKHFRFCDKIEKSLNLFFFSRGLSFRDLCLGVMRRENTDPGKHLKKKDLSSRNVHRRQQPERIEIFILSSLLLLRPMDTKTDFNLNNIATLSVISISLVKKFTSKCPETYSNLISTPLDDCQSW